MKTMPAQFIKYGDTFSLINRNGDVCLYCRTNKEGSTTYEVVIAQRMKHDREIGGRVVGNAGDEYLPSTNEWGRKGWTAKTYDHAIRIFKDRVAVADAKACQNLGDVTTVGSETGGVETG